MVGSSRVVWANLDHFWLPHIPQPLPGAESPKGAHQPPHRSFWFLGSASCAGLLPSSWAGTHVHLKLGFWLSPQPGSWARESPLPAGCPSGPGGSGVAEQIFGSWAGHFSVGLARHLPPGDHTSCHHPNKYGGSARSPLQADLPQLARGVQYTVPLWSCSPSYAVALWLVRKGMDSLQYVATVPQAFFFSSSSMVEAARRSWDLN